MAAELEHRIHDDETAEQMTPVAVTSRRGAHTVIDMVALYPTVVTRAG